MVGPNVMHVEADAGVRWSVALEILETGGEGAVGLGDVTLFSDPATERALRRLHVTFACPIEPLRGDTPRSERLGGVGETGLAQARALIGRACEADSRFQALVDESEVLYEFVYDYGMGTILVATAGRQGPLTWRE